MALTDSLDVWPETAGGGGYPALPADPTGTLPSATVSGAASTSPSAERLSCSCGHAKHAHQHYRAGSDCAFCACSRFHRPLLARLTRR